MVRVVRHHLVELEDLDWLPARFRDLGTDWLREYCDRTNLYRPVVPKLREVLEATGEREVLDLCSGSGGAWLSILRELQVAGFGDLMVQLSDKRPNKEAFAYVARVSGGRLTYEEHSVERLDVAWDGRTVRTMLFALHHFRPPDVRRILERAAQSGTTIAIIDAAGTELTRRIPRALLPLVLPLLLLGNIFLPLLVLLLTPLVRPFPGAGWF